MNVRMEIISFHSGHSKRIKPVICSRQERASGRAGERTRWLYKVKGRLTLTLKFVLFNAETDKLRYLISFTTITRERFIGRRYRPEAQMRVTCFVERARLEFSRCVAKYQFLLSYKLLLQVLPVIIYIFSLL